MLRSTSSLVKPRPRQYLAAAILPRHARLNNESHHNRCHHTSRRLRDDVVMAPSNRLIRAWNRPEQCSSCSPTIIRATFGNRCFSTGIWLFSPAAINASFGGRCFSTGLPSNSMATPPFQKLVEALKSSVNTCTVVESSCGGLISSSLMSVPGSSQVYFGGTVAYNTKRSGKLLCGDEGLHERLVSISSNAGTDTDMDGGGDLLDMGEDVSEETKHYIRAKVQWTRETAVAYCDHMQTDYSIAEGGATGPTFRPKGMHRGFAVLAVAGRKTKGGPVEMLAQKVCHSPHADRERNMRLFADSAAELCLEAMGVADPSVSVQSTQQPAQRDDEAGQDAGLFLDRCSHIRGTPKMEEFYQQPDALHVILRGTDEVLFATANELALPTLQRILEHSELGFALEECGTNMEEMLRRRAFLGRLGPSETPVFAAFLPKNASYDNGGPYFANTRPHAPKLVPVHNELALTATAYANWQKMHQYCCVCGSRLEYIHGGTCARCMGGKHLHWPRQDPSIIVLVASPTHALLARSPRHPPYLYTALAGFIEAGETIENATAREVHEEVGVDIDLQSIKYISSQPWPFPRSFMIGMSASPAAELAPFHIDPNEIVDAQWYEKEAVYQATRGTDEMGAVLERQVVEKKQASGEWSGKLLVPSKGILARTLIDNWLESS